LRVLKILGRLSCRRQLHQAMHRICIFKAVLALAALHHSVAQQSDHELLTANAERDEVTVTASGLQYEVLQRGPEDGKLAEVSSKCVVHYRGSLLNGGKEFDSSHNRGQPAKFKPSGVVPGFKEALLMMRAGDKFTFWLPSELGYGSRGSGSTIPGDASLVFEIEMIEVAPEATGIEYVKEMVSDNPMIVLGVAYMLFQGLMSLWNGGGGGGANECKIADAANQPKNVSVYLDIKIGDDEPEQIQMELFTEKCPKTTENFRALCTGEKGKGKMGKPLHFKGCVWHRIIPRFMCQGGDFTSGNGTGGESIYGNKFADEWENGYITHNKAGLLSMANAGKDTNGSQFFITLGACTHLDNKHVVFGQVTQGMDVVKKMEAIGSGSGSTSKQVVTVDCGELKGKST